MARNAIVADDWENFVLKGNGIAYGTRRTHHNRCWDFILFTGKETEGTQNKRVFFHTATLRIFSNEHVFSVLNHSLRTALRTAGFAMHLASLQLHCCGTIQR